MRQWRKSGEFEQIGALGRGQAHLKGDRLEDLAGGIDVTPLFKPRVPGDTDTGQVGDLLAAQTGGAGAAYRRQSIVRAHKMFPPDTQERAEFSAAFVRPCHASILVVPLLVPAPSSNLGGAVSEW